MNNARRKSLIAAVELLNQAQSIIEECRDEEQEYYDNMPESFQNGERGEAALAAIDMMESALSEIEGAVSSAEEASN